MEGNDKKRSVEQLYEAVKGQPEVIPPDVVGPLRDLYVCARHRAHQ